MQLLEFDFNTYLTQIHTHTITFIKTNAADSYGVGGVTIGRATVRQVKVEQGS